MRIVSLLPSATEIVCAIGLEKYLVGVTHECDYPPSIRSLPKVTETLIPRDASSADIDRLVRIRMVAAKLITTDSLNFNFEQKWFILIENRLKRSKIH